MKSLIAITTIAVGAALSTAAIEGPFVINDNADLVIMASGPAGSAAVFDGVTMNPVSPIAPPVFQSTLLGGDNIKADLNILLNNAASTGVPGSIYNVTSDAVTGTYSFFGGLTIGTGPLIAPGQGFDTATFTLGMGGNGITFQPALDVLGGTPEIQVLSATADVYGIGTGIITTLVASTVVNGDNTVGATVSYTDPAGDIANIAGIRWHFQVYAIPTPGGLGLLALSGLVATRRRR